MVLKLNSKLTFFQLLKNYGVNPEDVRLVRHGNKEINILDAYQTNLKRFTEYSAWQRPKKYGDSKILAIFAPARGTNSLFLGLWNIDGVIMNEDLGDVHYKLLQKYELPLKWFEVLDRYKLQPSELMCDLKERLVIDWGRSTVSWVQKRDKNVVEIKPKNSIGDFISYDNILLSYRELTKLVKDTDSNASWVNALSSVNGVYLIKHLLDGRLYVGSAYGKGGILRRWESYAKTGHAGNKLLKTLDPHNFEFSILEISPSTMSADDVIARENRWKVCLGTRDFGLNDN